MKYMEVKYMAKSAMLHTRMDEGLKNRAEGILSQIGLTSSEAINLFYRQIELNGGLPFELKVPEKVMAEQRLFEELEKGEQSAQKKGWMSIEESKAKLGL
jgi:DNA-damage-inducible protein J